MYRTPLNFDRKAKIRMISRKRVPGTFNFQVPLIFPGTFNFPLDEGKCNTGKEWESHEFGNYAQLSYTHKPSGFSIDIHNWYVHGLDITLAKKIDADESDGKE